jgi:hypothetical protein
MYTDFQGKNNPCFNKVTPQYFLGEPAFAHGDESPSTLVSGLVTTAPPLGFFRFHPFLTPQFTLHHLYRQPQQSRPSWSGTMIFDNKLNVGKLNIYCLPKRQKYERHLNF